MDIECVADISIDDTELFLQPDEILKHKVIFIAGYLSRKFPSIVHDIENGAADATLSSEFIKELDRGGFTQPTLPTAFFVHSAVHLMSVQRTPASVQT